VNDVIISDITLKINIGLQTAQSCIAKNLIFGHKTTVEVMTPHLCYMAFIYILAYFWRGCPYKTNDWGTSGNWSIL